MALPPMREPPSTMRPMAVLALATALAACGGQVGVPGTGGGAAGGAAGSSGSGGGTDAGAGTDAGWTDCSAPDWSGCNTPDCPDQRTGCTVCFDYTDHLMSSCAESLQHVDFSDIPPDGRIFLSDQPAFTTAPLYLEGVPYNAGILVAKHGQADRLGYADRGVWTGDPLPMPKTCPSIPDVPTCGGYCGGCPLGQVCTGRSPLHPYGICIPHDAGVCSHVTGINGSKCSSSEGCFIFKVEAAHQTVADATGFCVPLKECQAMAANLPGGGFCK